MADVIAYVCDLMFSTRITSAANAAGRVCSTVRNREQLESALDESTAIVLLDLDAIETELDQILQKVRAAAPSATVVGYLPHVRADLATASRAAGVDRVLARSAFVEQLPTLLSR